MNEDLDSLLTRQLELGETYEHRAEKVLKATPGLSEVERLVDILKCGVKTKKLLKPPHHPSLLMEFAYNHDWLWSRETKRGDVLYSSWGEGPVFRNMLHYAWLIEEMNKRGGDLNAARSIVKEERIEGMQNIWYHPPHTKKMSREQAAGKITIFYQRNRKRMIKQIEKQLSKQFGDRWFALPRWAHQLKVVQDILEQSPPPAKRKKRISAARSSNSRDWDPFEMRFAPIAARCSPVDAKRTRKNSVSK
jgi:hypothetical protein